MELRAANVGYFNTTTFAVLLVVEDHLVVHYFASLRVFKASKWRLDIDSHKLGDTVSLMRLPVEAEESEGARGISRKFVSAIRALTRKRERRGCMGRHVVRAFSKGGKISNAQFATLQE